MINLNIDFKQNCGKVKPMHAVNNGPVHKFTSDQRISNLDAFKEAGIPYARNHDAAFYNAYGGEHIVDVAMIFPNFDADPYDEKSYDFICTDEYLKIIDFAGVKTFYRLGNKIEHWIKKYGTLPPSDFKKWAVICEHIIRHYTEGWANGFNYDIEYWEIWNEPDLDPDNSTHKRTWGGTEAQFFELYEIAAKHLKKNFPHLKIGGPALAYNFEWAERFLEKMSANKVPLDFFSWHVYASDVYWVAKRINDFRELLDKYGYVNTESILNEWNYVCGWERDEWIETLKAEKSLKGSAFIAACMSVSQYLPLDILMYYDARPCAMNGMFNTDIPSIRLKGYYPFWMFNHLYNLESAVAVEKDDDTLFLSAATSADGNSAVLITYFDNNNNAPEREVKIELNNLKDGKYSVEFYCLDENNDARLVREEKISSTNCGFYINFPLYTSYLLKIKPL